MPQPLPPGKKPVIIAVHGTFAARHADSGGAWWQTDGPLVTTLERDSPGTFAWVPFHWSGKNLESERQRAARHLSTVINELETQRRPYHLVGHSHGGNVIWQALQRSSKRGELPYLKTWTTIGTPFMIYRSYLPALWSVLPLYVFWRLTHAQPLGLFHIISTTNQTWPAIASLTSNIFSIILYSINTLLFAIVASIPHRSCLSVVSVWARHYSETT